ncbi:MAG: hypothetical protein ACKVWR_02835 [Acidimicrobiales bacterium]
MFDLVSVLYHALEGAHTVEKHQQDAGGDRDLGAFFQQLQQSYRQIGEQAKQLLVQRIEHQH